jgi:selenide,water dikinase
MLEVGRPTAATDVTGYGLLGHLHEMLRASSVGARLSLASIPALDGARDLAVAGAIPGGTRRNLLAVQDHCRWSPEAGEADRLLLADAQTSGGLLIATPPEAAEALLERLSELGTPSAALVGEITDGREIVIDP